MTRLTAAALLLASSAFGAAPVLAETHTIAAGEGAQERLQEALILAQPGDEIVLEAGRFVLTDGLSLDVDGVTLRGESADTTILDFTNQQGSGEGLLVTSDNVTLRDFRMENPKGDGIKSKGADNIVYTKLIVTWTNGPDPSNGAYAIYPVESTGVLIDGVIVSGASDAGIYVGQSSKITVRNSIATENVAGIEIENSRDALVENNIATENTGGILVFDLPGLPVMGGGNVIVRNNIASGNNTPNFAPPGNIVAGVPSGTGVMVMANEKVWIEDNILSENATAPFIIVAYTQAYDDPRYNPYPRHVVIGKNIAENGGTRPDVPGGEQFAAAFGGAIPPILWDGLSDKTTPPLIVTADIPGVSLNLASQGQSMADARPGPMSAPNQIEAWDISGIGAPAELEERLK